MKFSLFLIVLLLPLSLVTKAQQLTRKQRTQLTAGVSTTDASNVGIRYRFNQSQCWLNIGAGGLSRNNHFVTIGPGFSQHLWGTSNKTDLKPWYVKVGMTGVNYALQQTRVFREEARIVYAKVHMGRDFNISKRIGVTLSVGPSARVYRKWNRPETRTHQVDLINYASFDLNFLYRLQKIS